MVNLLVFIQVLNIWSSDIPSPLKVKVWIWCFQHYNTRGLA